MLHAAGRASSSVVWGLAITILYIRDRELL